jgi:membrane-associated phospholipid phosphatase
MYLKQLFVAILVVPLAAQIPADPDPGLREFPRELGHTFVQIFHRDSLLPLGIGAATTGAAAVAKPHVTEYFGQTRRFREFGQTGHIIGSPGVVAGTVGGLFYLGRRSSDPTFRAMTYSLAQANVVTAGLTAAAKGIVSRERPNEQNRASFFSGHSSSMFTSAAVLAEYHSPRVYVPAYAVATLVAASRIEKNKHRLSDLTIGAAVGYIAGKAAVRSRHRWRGSRVTASAAPLPRRGVIGRIYVSLDESQ